ncbi:GAF and ANTAR domain-containing protein [Sciscionella marina]|uniref:GAF and ANTAR domain-containing protein n=1 Tax=Sciscionella marina TaxID=508770 RepID=UPI000376F4CE|nr:GAF and ANTAR domain-containing protein [Sciscionella marina]
MDEHRRQQLEQLLNADGDGEHGSQMSLICTRLVTELAVTGAGATVLTQLGDSDGHGPSRGLVHASNEVSAGLEDLQLTVGEGPCLDTFGTGGPVLVAHLANETARWPAFTRDALELGAAAVFSFPLQIGVVRLGSLDCYRDTPGPLTQAQVADALILAELATHAVITELDGHRTDDMSWLADSHAEVHQATGMVAVQLAATTDAALLRLRGYAYTNQLPLAEVASQVVGRTLRFSPDDP